MRLLEIESGVASVIWGDDRYKERRLMVLNQL